METKHERVEVIIPQQIHTAKQSGRVQNFKVIFDDRPLRAATLLLCHLEMDG